MDGADRKTYRRLALRIRSAALRRIEAGIEGVSGRADDFARDIAGFREELRALASAVSELDGKFDAVIGSSERAAAVVQERMEAALSSALSKIQGDRSRSEQLAEELLHVLERARKQPDIEDP